MSVCWLLRVVRGVVFVRERFDVRSSFRANGLARKKRTDCSPRMFHSPFPDRVRDVDKAGWDVRPAGPFCGWDILNSWRRRPEVAGVPRSLRKKGKRALIRCPLSPWAFKCVGRAHAGPRATPPASLMAKAYGEA